MEHAEWLLLCWVYFKKQYWTAGKTIVVRKVHWQPSKKYLFNEILSGTFVIKLTHSILAPPTLFICQISVHSHPYFKRVELIINMYLHHHVSLVRHFATKWHQLISRVKLQQIEEYIPSHVSYCYSTRTHTEPIVCYEKTLYCCGQFTSLVCNTVNNNFRKQRC